ncbi:hypothetical protein DFW101_2356 [Solidesulfovibrio carbinoliphilus subsp. oakridgensis]|uniref:Lipoprotein n=1 Tax=Solidesulfovibrio carbinoliphilus subsp. oakridgensis TaxID=694327 RepID=G7QB19_9BACT|nr:DUF4881 domain-containing protein [Solidesulfovibrio carbinoliphilus]EHJ48360.1 hypothetical protein DFW101_2356 [Solidesulfovibrio carbinoliphilus subsp. oakridgensis]
MRTMFTKLLLAALAVVFLAGCVDYGKVDQGRTVAIDKEKKLITMIPNMSTDPAKGDFKLPAITFTYPTDPQDMGQEPKAGLRMKLDTDKGEIVLYDPKKQNFETIPIQIVDKQQGIDSKHPLVFDATTEKAKKFPVVDKDKKLVTIYSGSQKMLVSFIPPEEYLALPASAWDAGDIVRIYFKTEGTALRVMNVTSTNIFKK